jgi:hypothetical protein
MNIDENKLINLDIGDIIQLKISYNNILDPPKLIRQCSTYGLTEYIYNEETLYMLIHKYNYNNNNYGIFIPIEFINNKLRHNINYIVTWVIDLDNYSIKTIDNYTLILSLINIEKIITIDKKNIVNKNNIYNFNHNSYYVPFI